MQFAPPLPQKSPGAYSTTKLTRVLQLQPGENTFTLPVLAPVGTVVVIAVAVLAVIVAFTLPNVTSVALPTLVPRMSDGRPDFAKARHCLHERREALIQTEYRAHTIGIPLRR